MKDKMKKLQRATELSDKLKKLNYTLESINNSKGGLPLYIAFYCNQEIHTEVSSSFFCDETKKKFFDFMEDIVIKEKKLVMDELNKLL